MKKIQVGHDLYLVGKASKIVPSAQVAHLLRERGESSDHLTVYYRLQKMNQLIYSALYDRVKKRNSYTVCFIDCGTLKFGQIQFFFTLSGNPVAAVKLLETDHSAQHHFQLTFNALDSRIFLVKRVEVLKVIPVQCIKEKCVFIDLQDNLYVARFTTAVSMD